MLMPRIQKSTLVGSARVVAYLGPSDDASPAHASPEAANKGSEEDFS